MIRDDLKRGLAKFAAESLRGALRAPFRRVSRFLTLLTKRGYTASPSSASSPSSSLLITLALEEPFLAPPAPLKYFRAAAFLGGSARVVVGVLEKDPAGSIKFSCPMSLLKDGSGEAVSANAKKRPATTARQTESYGHSSC